MEGHSYISSVAPRESAVVERPQAERAPSVEPSVRVMLWCVPRSLSTAFLKCIDNMPGPMEIFHEPYSVAYYFGPEKRAPPDLNCPKESQYTYSWVRHQLEAGCTSPVFCKDMAFAVDGRYDAIPAGFRHTFLIRKPVKSLMSFHKVVNGYPGYTETVSVKNGLPKGYAFKESYDLYNHICKNYREKPIVIDADDLCRSPAIVVRKYCEAVGLPFSEKMLSWKASDCISSRWHCAPSFTMLNSVMGTYDRALKSTHFFANDHPGKCHSSTVTSSLKDHLPEDVLDCSNYCEPYYQKMYENRLKP